MITNSVGETKIFMPTENQVMLDNSGAFSSDDEMLMQFLKGRVDDLGIAKDGYVQTSSETTEDGLLKRTFANKLHPDAPKAEIVYKDYLPIYCAFVKSDGSFVSKTYLSQYKKIGRMSFPHRTTAINFTSAKDSSIVRTVYSNVVADSSDPLFDYQVPSTAQTVTMPAAK